MDVTGDRSLGSIPDESEAKRQGSRCGTLIFNGWRSPDY